MGLLLVAVVGLCFGLSAGKASAAYSEDLGTVVSGAVGGFTFSGGGITGLWVDGEIFGNLPPLTMIEFTYNSTGPFLFQTLTSSSQYNGGLEYSFENAPSGAAGSSAGSLVITSAQIISSQDATGIIKNLSSEIADFQSVFAGFFSGLGEQINIEYSVSAVPVPAALPLFVMGLGGLVFGARRKKKAQADSLVVA